MKRIAMMLALLVAGVLGGAVTATPAQADPPAQEAYIIMAHGEKFPGWFWIDEIEGIIGCIKCRHWFELDTREEITVNQEVALKQHVMAGLDHLSRATVATDPRTRAAHRTRALAQFMSAARAIGRADLTAGPVGYYDPDRNETVETGAPWLHAATDDIADGITKLQHALGDPSPDPWIQAATVSFDQAYEHLNSKKVIGG